MPDEKRTFPPIGGDIIVEERQTLSNRVNSRWTFMGFCGDGRTFRLFGSNNALAAPDAVTEGTELF